MPDNTIIGTGSKGGVGTTTVALNLAVQLAMQTRKRAGLLDLARPFGQISLMLDLEPRFTILDALERIERLDEALLASMAMRHKTGVEILAGPLHAPMKAEQRQSVTFAALTKLVEIASRAFELRGDRYWRRQCRRVGARVESCGHIVACGRAKRPRTHNDCAPYFGGSASRSGLEPNTGHRESLEAK